MKTYVLLFRGINVGGKNRLPMKELVSLLSEMGFREIRTYIQSGNIVLEGDEKPDDAIPRQIEARFGFSPGLIVLGKGDFEKAVRACPYESADGKEIQFYFTARDPQPDWERIGSLAAPSEKYELKGNVFYLYAPEGVGRSKLVAGLEKSLGVSSTGRNLNTVKKIGVMLDG